MFPVKGNGILTYALFLSPLYHLRLRHNKKDLRFFADIRRYFFGTLPQSPVQDRHR